MNLHKLIFTNNACYKAGRRITPKGIMVHSTGANNPWLKRYVGPDDGLLGKNQYNNHWNQSMDREVCVHAFIGKLADGTVATYQTLPWDYRGWHCAGSGNDTHISFEICEDYLTDAAYLDKVYNEAVYLCVYLCELYGLTEQDIICHCEGHDLGIASNHGDVLHWWPKHGKNMDTFRAAVKDKLGGSVPDTPVEPEQPGGKIKAGDLVTITGTKYYGGQTIPAWVRKQKWYVYEVSGDRAVINKNESGANAIMSPVRVSDLALVLSAAVTYRVHTVVKGDILWGMKNLHGLDLEASEDVPISSFPRRRDYKAVTVTTDMPTLLKAAIEQNFVPVVDDRNVFIGMVRRTVLLRELYDKYTTLPTDKRFKGSHPPM